MAERAVATPPFPFCDCERSAAILENKVLNPKSEILNNMKKQSVISSQRLAND